MFYIDNLGIMYDTIERVEFKGIKDDGRYEHEIDVKPEDASRVIVHFKQGAKDSLGGEDIRQFYETLEAYNVLAHYKYNQDSRYGKNKMHTADQIVRAAQDILEQNRFKAPAVKLP